ncbi:MAG: toll/interleukin-1 receptor domain-containing protein [Chloroflexota bacterium]
MHKAFIAYDPADRKLAVRLWDELRWNGLNIGIDLQDVPLHIDRAALLEDIVFRCDLVMVVVGETYSDEVRRLHALAIEQEATVIIIRLPGADVPPELASTRTVFFGDYAAALSHLLRLIPTHMLDTAVDTDRVLQNLRHQSRDVRRTTLFLVGKSRIHAGMRPAMSLMLSDPEPDVRAAAAWALQQLGNVDTAPALIAALQDVSYDVRSNAGWALVDIGRRRDSPASNAITTEVIAVLRDGESYDTREMAYQVLLRLGGRDASEAIKKYWDE